MLKSFILSLSLALLSWGTQAEKYLFVSHSMNDSALQAYFKQAQEAGVILVMRGLVENSFQATKAKSEGLKISYDIDPVLFDTYGVTVVPTLVVKTKGSVKKISGHLPLSQLFEILEGAS